jgi:glycerophosphoryl diester phosphodiesterase
MLDRTTTGTGPLFAHDLEYIRSLDAGSWFDDKYRSERVPTLDEVLAWMASSLSLSSKHPGHSSSPT